MRDLAPNVTHVTVQARGSAQNRSQFDARTSTVAASANVLSDDELVARTDGVWSALERTHLELMNLLAEVDRREAWRDDGADDVTHWVSMRYGISAWKAARWVEAARALGELPATATALGSGRLGIDHVVELCRFATPETERGLITWAAEARRARCATAPSSNAVALGPR